jgi:dCMP deaminase
MTRPTWDRYFMDLAQHAASRATCSRKHVGCVLVSTTNRVLVTGYNGSISGLSHCDDSGHDMLDGHCARTVHAEANAVADAARRGVALSGSVAYVTALPCWPCAKLLFQAGAHRVVYGEAYRIDDEAAKRTFEAAARLGVRIDHLPLVT